MTRWLSSSQPGTKLAHTLIWDFWSPELSEVNVCHSSQPVRGVLLRLPEQTKNLLLWRDLSSFLQFPSTHTHTHTHHTYTKHLMHKHTHTPYIWIMHTLVHIHSHLTNTPPTHTALIYAYIQTCFTLMHTHCSHTSHIYLTYSHMHLIHTALTQPVFTHSHTPSSSSQLLLFLTWCRLLSPSLCPWELMCNAVLKSFPWHIGGISGWWARLQPTTLNQKLMSLIFTTTRAPNPLSTHRLCSFAKKCSWRSARVTTVLTCKSLWP